MPALDQGFAVLPAVLTLEKMEPLAGELAGVDSAGSRRLLDHAWCRDLAAVVLSRASGLLPECESLRVVQATYFNKSEQANWLVPFHQDRSIPVSPSTPRTQAGWSQKEGMTFVQGSEELLQQMLALRLHVDPSHAGNGPLRVLPGSHREGILNPEEIDTWRNRCDERILTAAAGSVIAMRPLLLHASSKSNTPQPRRVIQFLCAPHYACGDLDACGDLNACGDSNACGDLAGADDLKRTEGV